MDHAKALDSIVNTMRKAGCPLTEDQRMILAGSFAVWSEHAYQAGRADQAILEVQGRDRFIADLKKQYGEPVR